MSAALPPVVNFADKLRLFSDLWAPKIIAQMNGTHLKLARLQGEFVWHSHPDTDEVFILLEGSLEIELTEGVIALRAGEMTVIPRGAPHWPRSAKGCAVLLIEPAGTLNTGDAGGALTAPADAWI